MGSLVERVSRCTCYGGRITAWKPLLLAVYLLFCYDEIGRKRCVLKKEISFLFSFFPAKSKKTAFNLKRRKGFTDLLGLWFSMLLLRSKLIEQQNVLHVKFVKKYSIDNFT